MSVSGSLHSSLSGLTFADLPNLPGVRRDISTANPKLYKEFKASRSGTSLLDERSAIQEDEISLSSYFEGSKLLEYSRSLSAFPTAGDAYNDISGRYSLKSQQRDRLSKSRSLPYCSLDSAPAFVSNNSRICRFVGCFTETTPENLLEVVRARKVEIVYYTEDNTIEINEPKVPNSGLQQGKILKRHQVLKPSKSMKNLPPLSDTMPSRPGSSNVPYYTLADFYAGAEIQVYGRAYQILDCDSLTRRYFEDELGILFGEPMPLPTSYYEPRSRANTSKSSPNKRVKSFKALSFFQYDKKILRFFGLWDNRGELFGDKVYVRLHFSLADQTFEVVPMHERNSGRDRLNVLLKKTKLMKKRPDFNELEQSSHVSSSSSLTGSMNGGGTMGGTNNNPVQEVNDGPHPYTWKDLYIGLQMTIASMNIVIIDADEFTREFYNSKNRPLGPPLEQVLELHPGVTKKMEEASNHKSEDDMRSLPPNDGFLPIAPPKDGAKAKLYMGMILRYLATFKDPKPADVSRKFIIQVHLEDDTIQIREPPQRNSGHVGGIFLARDLFENRECNRYLLPQDFFVGATIGIRAHKFIIHDADEYTLRYMEANEKLWTFSDLKGIMTKLKSREEIIRRNILTTSGLANQVFNYNEVFDMLNQCGLGFVKQEAITLCRSLDPTKTGSVKVTKILKYIMDYKE